ncbi:AMP-binding protein [Desulfobacter sp.]|uniref:AMP-binding protein n=1 Tax=Desulfobacter sp. TaxID=2294 RepID=UPI003D14C897
MDVLIKGHPKAIPHTHDHCLFTAQAVGADYMGFQQDDVVLSSGKFHHALGFCLSMLFPFFMGATTVADPDKPALESTIKLIKTHRVTIFSSVPVFFGMQ